VKITINENSLMAPPIKNHWLIMLNTANPINTGVMGLCGSGFFKRTNGINPYIYARKIVLIK
jgi:hypothetical protein